MLLLKIQNHILIPNYLLNFTTTTSLKLKDAYDYASNISYLYLKKIQGKFYTQFSLISYNPYMFPKYYSNSKKHSNYRKCICFKYVIIYRIYDNYVDILDIFHYKSNYSKIML